MTPRPLDARKKESWENTAPALYSIVTGFFPETSPKDTWATNPRPLLVCGRAIDDATGMVFCRIAYGTSKVAKGSHPDDLTIGNLSLLNQTGLKVPTRFVIHSGNHMVILPWISEFFRPWSGKKTPILGVLPSDIQRHVGHTLATLTNLPQF